MYFSVKMAHLTFFHFFFNCRLVFFLDSEFDTRLVFFQNREAKLQFQFRDRLSDREIEAKIIVNRQKHLPR